jgi:hypothetical protein
MKSGPALWCALSLLLGSVTCPGIEETVATSVPPSPAITADDQFFVDHPDLKDEGKIVHEASEALTAEGYSAGTAKVASETLAARSRAILAERTPAEWQQKAVSLYPALGIAGTELNLLFVKHYRELKASGAAFTEEPSWPVLLAKRCDDELRSRNPAASQTISAPPPSAAAVARHPDDGNSVRQTHRAGNFWQTFIALLLLIVLTALPGAYAFLQGVFGFQKGSFTFRRGASVLRKGALAFPKGLFNRPAPLERSPAAKSDPSIWRGALKHAAIIYVVVALPTSVHSLMANSDLGFIDRLFVSLLVGSLFGLFITLPLYGIDTLWQACQKHPARPATR